MVVDDVERSNGRFEGCDNGIAGVEDVDRRDVAAGPSHRDTDVMTSEGEKLFTVCCALAVEPTETKHYAATARRREAVRVALGGEVGLGHGVAVRCDVFVDPFSSTIGVQHAH